MERDWEKEEEKLRAQFEKKHDAFLQYSADLNEYEAQNEKALFDNKSQFPIIVVVHRRSTVAKMERAKIFLTSLQDYELGLGDHARPHVLTPEQSQKFVDPCHHNCFSFPGLRMVITHGKPVDVASEFV